MPRGVYDRSHMIMGRKSVATMRRELEWKRAQMQTAQRWAWLGLALALVALLAAVVSIVTATTI